MVRYLFYTIGRPYLSITPRTNSEYLELHHKPGPINVPYCSPPSHSRHCCTKDGRANVPTGKEFIPPRTKFLLKQGDVESLD